MLIVLIMLIVPISTKVITDKTDFVKVFLKISENPISSSKFVIFDF